MTEPHDPLKELDFLERLGTLLNLKRLSEDDPLVYKWLAKETRRADAAEKELEEHREQVALYWRIKNHDDTRAWLDAERDAVTTWASRERAYNASSAPGGSGSDGGSRSG